MGVQYYRGITSLDENLLFKREPNNPYDKNAIRVDNVANIQVGQYFPSGTFVLIISIPREVAAVLAPLLDMGHIEAEGTVVEMRNAYNIPITIQLFSRAPIAQQIFAQLSSKFNISEYPAGLGRGTLKAHPPVTPAAAINTKISVTSSYSQLIRDSIAFDSRALKETTEKFGMSIKDLESLEAAVQPPKVKTPLLHYQLQGLKWLLNMEHPKLPVKPDELRQFWKKVGNNWFNIATN